MKPHQIQGYLAFFVLLLMLGIILLLTEGCAYQRYDTITKVQLPQGGTFTLPKGGALVNVEVTKNAGTVEKSTPFDFLRGLGQGSAVSAAPGATSTQSGTATQDNSPQSMPANAVGIDRTIGDLPAAATPELSPEQINAILGSGIQ